MCNESLLDYLDDVPEDQRRYANPVPKRRVDAAVKALGSILGVMEQHVIVQVMGEIGLLDCLQFTDDITRDRIQFRMSDAQCIAAAAALGAVFEETTRPSGVVVEDVA